MIADCNSRSAGSLQPRCRPLRRRCGRPAAPGRRQAVRSRRTDPKTARIAGRQSDRRCPARRDAPTVGADITFVNASGVRTSLIPNRQAARSPTASFRHAAVRQQSRRQDPDGAQLKALLEQQFEMARTPPPSRTCCAVGKVLLRLRSVRPASRIVSMTLERQAGRPHGRYRVTVNNFSSRRRRFHRARRRHGRVRRRTGPRRAGSVAARPARRCPNARPDEAAPSGASAAALVEAAQVARVERVAFALQQAERLDTDPKVLADRALVEGVGLVPAARSRRGAACRTRTAGSRRARGSDSPARRRSPIPCRSQPPGSG